MNFTKIFKRQVNMSKPERWISGSLGGALASYGIYRRDPLGVGLAILGGALAYRGATGHCDVYGAVDAVNKTRREATKSVRIEKTITVNQTPEKAYEFWRNLENLPRFMQHLERVEVRDDRHSHWVAKGPLGTSVEWDAEIVNDAPGKLIQWRSDAGSGIESCGMVRFKKKQNGKGTKIHVSFDYRPGSVVDATMAKLFREEPQQQVQEDMARLKEVLETA